MTLALRVGGRPRRAQVGQRCPRALPAESLVVANGPDVLKPRGSLAEQSFELSRVGHFHNVTRAAFGERRQPVRVRHAQLGFPGIGNG